MATDNVKYVLLVEDEPDLRAMLLLLLADPRWDILEAENLSQARQLLEAHSPPLILLDLHLPDGSGYEILEEAKEQQDAPIVFIQSAYSSPEEKEKAAAKGADHFFSKPTDVSLLKNMIEQVFVHP